MQLLYNSIQPNVNQLSPESKQFMAVDLSTLIYCNQCLLLLLPSSCSNVSISNIVAFVLTQHGDKV